MNAKWQTVWRKGIAPQLDRHGIEELRIALIIDDSRLIQGTTTCPNIMDHNPGRACEAGCGIAFPIWQADTEQDIHDISEKFSLVCDKCDADLLNATGDEVACRFFINWFDDTPRQIMRKLLLDEVELWLAEHPKEEEPT